MNCLKICSTPMSSLLASTLLCIPLSYAISILKNPNENWEFMMNISKLMQQYTTDSMASKWNGMNSKNRPNLAYEPYWYNYLLKEHSLKDNCDRCSDIFKKYQEVCAVDSHGEMLVNMSMCAVLRQNCLGGVLHGTINGKKYDLQGNTLTVAENWARFSIRIYRDAHVLLSSTDKPWSRNGPFYQFIFEGWYGWYSRLYKITQKNTYLMQQYTHYWYKDRVFSHWNEYVEFVVRWNETSGWLLLTKSAYTDWTKGFHINITDYYPFTLRFISISSAEGFTGDYVIRDLIITSLSGCSASAEVKPLPTNPTANVPIVSRLHVLYEDFKQRMKDIGINDTKKVKVDTKEEY